MEKKIRSEKEVVLKAISLALKALRKRHLAEEAAHAPAITALSGPLAYQGSEWKEKAEKYELELHQCYKARSQISEQLVIEFTDLRASKALVKERESLIAYLQKEVSELSGECSHLKSLLEERTKGLELLLSENNELKIQFEEAMLKAKTAEAENKNLVDRLIQLKMQDAGCLNEANEMCKDMRDQHKGRNSTEQLAQQQVDGVVRPNVLNIL